MSYVCTDCDETYDANGVDPVPSFCPDCGGEVVPVRTAPRVKQWEVVVYELDRAYGGAEEGGWWYNCGTRKGTCRRVFNTRDAAYAYARRLSAHLDRSNAKLRYKLGSVCYSGGFMDAQVHARGSAPAYFPQTRPHYE